MSTNTQTTGQEGGVDAGEYGGNFRKDRMRDAHYWAAQARGFMEEQVIGLAGEWYVEIMAGDAIIVVSDEFPDGGVEALQGELRNHGFPEETVRELERYDETRLFITPTDDRLTANLGRDDWWNFENGEYGTDDE
jgi:hypothetical protein